MASIALTTRRRPSRDEFGRRQGTAMQITGLQRLGTSIVLHNGDDLMRQMHASLRLLAAAHDSCLDGVAAHFGAKAVRSSRYTAGASRTSDLRVRDLWLGYITLQLHFGTIKIL